MSESRATQTRVPPVAIAPGSIDPLRLVSRFVDGLDDGVLSRASARMFLSGMPMDVERPRDKETGGDGNFDIMQSLLHAMSAESLPIEEVFAFVNGQPTCGEDYWQVDKPRLNVRVRPCKSFNVSKKFAREKRHYRSLRVGGLGDGVVKAFPKTIRNVGNSHVVIRAVRKKKMTYCELFKTVGRTDALVTLPQFHAALAAKQRRERDRTNLVGFARGKDGNIWLLHANWLVMFGFGYGPDEVVAFRLRSRMRDKLNMMRGVDVVVPKMPGKMR